MQSEKKPTVIDKTSMERLEKALLPYEKQLQAQTKIICIIGYYSWDYLIARPYTSFTCSACFLGFLLI